jgi:hypothetical protein
LKPVPVPAVRTFTIIGKDANGFAWTQQVSAQLLGPTYFALAAAITNAASGTLPAARGMAMSVYGAGLAATMAQADGLPLPLSLGNVTASVNGIPAPLYFVSPEQVNLQIPWGTCWLRSTTTGRSSRSPRS